MRDGAAQATSTLFFPERCDGGEQGRRGLASRDRDAQGHEQLFGFPFELVTQLAQGRLDEAGVSWRNDVAMTVVMATKGYPGPYDKGSEIKGLDAAARVPGVVVFHAGTKPGGANVLANGGRVLNITALGSSVEEARARAYEAVGKIDWPEGFCRSDIGWRAINREP